MRSLRCRRLALLLAASLALHGAPLAAQEPGPAPQAGSAPQAGPAPSGGIAGSWEGWARLTNDWPGLGCRYDGGPGATSVRLELTADGSLLRGSVAIDLPAVQGSGCPPLRKRYLVREVATGEGTASFTDSGGNEWTLSVRRQGSVLQGLIAWQQGGAQEPLADGFVRPDGVRPMARLSGEVRLARAGGAEPAETAAAPAAEAGAAKKPGGGGHVGHVAAIIGANVVGLSALYGVNKLGKGSSASGSLTCSPRSCIVGAPNAPCFCESTSNVVSGASCGSTTGGQPLNAPCSPPDNPCQAGLSCNSNLCEDKSGRCAY